MVCRNKVSWFPYGVWPLPLPPNRRLSHLGVEVSGIETWKLDSHLEHCSKLAHNAEQLYQSTQAAAKAAEMKLDSQRLALESQRLNEQVLQPPASSHDICAAVDIYFGFRICASFQRSWAWCKTSGGKGEAETEVAAC